MKTRMEEITPELHTDIPAHSSAMLSLQCLPLLLISTYIFLKGGNCGKTRPFLRYYETLSYDQTGLLQSHQRSKRAANEEEKSITLHLTAYTWKFVLMLRRDNSAFTDDFKVVSHNKTVPMDISFVYKGKLRDENDSFCHGSIINGYFHGSIQTKNGTFYVEYEENENDMVYSYIYHESDIDYTLMKDVNYFELALKTYQFLETMKWKPIEEPIIRPKRNVDLSRTTCLLHLKADYLFFKRFTNLQAAISHIAGYLMSVNALFEQINFNGIKHINFKVKVLNVIREEEPNSSMNSLYIGPEKLLMLHSRSNWNNVCLSYLLTNRDYNGILGLAWTGKTESDRPTCGNQIVEDGEMCDVGFDDNDTCCYSVNAEEVLQCTLKPGKLCSPSQGQCCSQLCSYKPEGEHCHDETECTYENYCTGESAKCPAPTPKNNYTICHNGTRICVNGMCSQSICTKYGLDQCDCDTENMYEKCQLCCQKPGDMNSCKSTKSQELSHLFDRSLIALPAGAPCGQRQGYCDKFHVCRLVDADGPIARLKNSFLNLIEYDPAAWMKTRWWAILLIILSLAAMMAGTIFIFGRTMDSNKVKSPKKEPAKTKSRQQNTHLMEVVYMEREVNISSSHVHYRAQM
ncbi:disintegrin and metalloproteinase domain-containing protein 10-like isoform X4 [Hyperolius riggenbachi]|uniref:disintegrin and metalloproteinase domain-containing protein 10-like isoform X4 n=1 Tax=Hyperolius riggenbachi TaxID=752182 RepID=UPI0035A3C389